MPTCDYCNADVAPSASSCPKCGKENPGQRSASEAIKLVLQALGALLLAGLVIGTILKVFG